MKRRRITVDEWKHIPAGTTIPNGYSNDYCTAPSGPASFYTLYEVADENNCHVGWEWVEDE